MGEQIVRQPDGKLAVFSSITDTIVVYDATGDELIERAMNRAAQDAARDTRRQIEAVEAGTPQKVYFQFARTWDEVLAKDQEHGGEAWLEFLGK